MRLYLRETFETFSHSCPKRELIDLGATGYHNCLAVLEVSACSLSICPRVCASKSKERQFTSANSAIAQCQCELMCTGHREIMKCVKCGREYPVRTTVTTP